ncbi:terminase gpP N-terminus-related DNA-binding protein [Cypionkella sp. TWP1-2-1b2]|uniref:terminase gpP N-terminus-related DNA-binding protein n=1 Tax=Cypionkella sp. TWP1-2-1b2 TaxID=2804675 RepID=UPI003CFAEE95
MKRVHTIARVRRAFYVQGWSVKKIVRGLQVSRNTVRENPADARDGLKLKARTAGAAEAQAFGLMIRNRRR